MRRQSMERGKLKRHWFRRRRPLIVTAVATAVSLLTGGMAAWALAKPATPVIYREGASATRYSGLAFDTCEAPKRNVMQAWKQNSPYGAVGIYISGPTRACNQSELTKDWITDVAAQGWKFLPLDVGLQAPCADRTNNPMSRDLATAYAQGHQAASRALKAAGGLRIQAGSALYTDIESFSSSDPGCADAVRSYVSGWTVRLHDKGYLAGVYGNLQSAVRTLSASHEADAFFRPDVVWSANWDRRTDLRGWAGVPDEQWAAGQRVKQYVGDHTESYGGFSLLIDTNALDAPVATVAQRYPVTGTQPATAFLGPAAAQAVRRAVSVGTIVSVVCRIGTPGGTWDKLTDGSWIPDISVAGGAPKPALPPCAVPFQVETPGAWTRTGPALDFVEQTSLSEGTLAWVQCETPGITLGRPGYWASLAGGGWMSGAVLSRQHLYRRSVGVPLCELPKSPTATVTS